MTESRSYKFYDPERKLAWGVGFFVSEDDDFNTDNSPLLTLPPGWNVAIRMYIRQMKVSRYSPIRQIPPSVKARRLTRGCCAPPVPIAGELSSPIRPNIQPPLSPTPLITLDAESELLFDAFLAATVDAEESRKVEESFDSDTDELFSDPLDDTNEDNPLEDIPLEDAPIERNSLEDDEPKESNPIEDILLEESNSFEDDESKEREEFIAASEAIGEKVMAKQQDFLESKEDVRTTSEKATRQIKYQLVVTHNNNVVHHNNHLLPLVPDCFCGKSPMVWFVCFVLIVLLVFLSTFIVRCLSIPASDHRYHHM